MKKAKKVDGIAKPAFTHDCDSCTFLGHVRHEGRSWDLYTCEQGGVGRTYIARFGNEGPEYGSMPVAIPGTLYALAAKLDESRRAHTRMTPRWVTYVDGTR